MNPIINIANNHDDFVGIKLEDGIPYVSFPYGFELSNLEENPRELNKYILLLTKTISTTNSLIKKEEDISKKDSFSEDFPLYDYIWIISDYIDRGIYKSKEKVYHTKHKGKINWKKTLTGSFTISNNNVIYNNLIFEKDKDIDDEITKIHLHCLNVAYNLIGWLFGSIDIPHFDIINIDVNRFLLILQNKITKVFDDETKLLLTTMINILSNNKSVKSKFNIYKFGTDRFHIVWENIIDTLFSNTNINDYYPTAKYYLLNKDPKLAISSLRPDTLIIKDNNSVVIDSKYYRYGITNNNLHLPPISDIQKQLSYGEYIYDKLNHITDLKMYNSFILPFNKEQINNNEQNIIYTGFASVDWIETSKLRSHEKIAILLVDTKYSLEEYSKFNKNHRIDKILNLLERSIT